MTAAFQLALCALTFTFATAADWDRVETLAKKWNSEVPVTKADNAPIDRAGACYYDEENHKVAVHPKALAYTDENLTACLAAAFAQARYSEIEAQWLAHVGEHEAYIIRKGEILRVSADKDVAPASARDLWLSLAARELVTVAQAPAATNSDASRGVASEDATAADKTIRKLLGLR